ncbi:cytochrome P450 [Mycena filopes]|nr:cytochrome P450 [Mycena filopes]
MISVQTPGTAVTCVVGLAFGLALYRLQASRNRRSLPLPPGPPRLPLLGNVFDIPAVHPWETYMRWSKEYDTDILHLDLAGASLIVLCSLEATDALLEKRSAIYSDRPRLPMVMELMGWEFNVGMMKYGEEWRIHRRLFNQGFTGKAAAKYQPKQLSATHQLLRCFLQEPEEFMAHFRQWASDIIMMAAYGIEVLPANDPYVKLAHEAGTSISNAGVPGKYLVDSLPILKYVPSWLPGAGFKRDAEVWKILARRFVDVPLAETKRQMAVGIAPPAFASDSLSALNDGDENYYTEDAVRATAATVYLGGADTTVSAVNSFVLGMLANPDAQRRAQAEIDSVTRGERLPDFGDEALMPYVGAVVKETLRWKNVGPMAIPHYLNVVDEFRGYRIPANSIVIGNVWAILHNEAVYPDPYAFKPERFLLDGKPNPAVPDPECAFGFGRRLCPGREMARDSLWVAVVSIMASFDITKALDEHGQEIEPTYQFDSGFINAPLPFKCCIRPRSMEAESLVRATAL